MYIEHLLRGISSIAFFFMLVIAPASADFTRPTNISPAGQHAESPQVATASNGDAVFIWRNRSSGIIQARSRSAAGVLGELQDISLAGRQAIEPQVDIAANGDAVIVWLWYNDPRYLVQMRLRTASGVLGPVRTLSGPRKTASDPRVAVAPNGFTIVVWRLRDRIQARADWATGSFSGIQNLSPTRLKVRHPSVGIAENGDAVVAWVREIGDDQRIQARSRAANGVLRPLDNLSLQGRGGPPDVAVDPDGNAIVVWKDLGERRIKGRVRSTGGVLSPIVELSLPGAAFAPRVAMQEDGDSIVVWHQNGIRARTRSAAGVLGAIENISLTGNESSHRVAYDATEVAAFIWRNVEENSATYIQGRTRSAAGVLGPIENLSGLRRDAADPQVAKVDGKALAVWEHLDRRLFSRVQAAAGP